MKIQSIILLCSGVAFALVQRMPAAEPQLGFTTTLTGGPLTGVGGAGATPTAASGALSGAAPSLSGDASGAASPTAAGGHVEGSGPDDVHGRIGGDGSASSAEGCIGGGAGDQEFTACGPAAAPTPAPGK